MQNGQEQPKVEVVDVSFTLGVYTNDQLERMSEAEFAKVAAEAQGGKCRYCDSPVHFFEDGQGGILCDFHYDWEAACNLSEDEFGGSVFGWWVRQKMAEWNWTDEQIEARLSRETV